MLRSAGRPLIATLAMIIVTTLPAAAADESYYTAKQADDGHMLFNNHCAECHRPDLTGALGPALVGKTFFARWGGKAIEDLFQFEHEKMPATSPGSLPKDQILKITAYILKRNGFKAGDKPLDEQSAKGFKLPEQALASTK